MSLREQLAQDAQAEMYDAAAREHRHSERRANRPKREPMSHYEEMHGTREAVVDAPTEPTDERLMFRRTRGGRWAVMGPADVVAPGVDLAVRKRDGSVSAVTISDTGATFERDGEQFVYGYPAKREAS